MTGVIDSLDAFCHQNIGFASPVRVWDDPRNGVSHLLVELIGMILVIAYIPYLFPEILVQIDVR